MDLKDAETQWTLYDANVQTYRSNSLATQSLLLAIGAFVKDDAAVLLVAFAVAMLQMWYIWFRVIRTRTIISDYYKFNFKYQFSSFVNNRGALDENTADPLTEETYAGNAEIRKKANRILAARQGLPKLRHNFRLTRIKLDIILPASLTLLWLTLVISHTSAGFYLGKALDMLKRYF